MELMAPLASRTTTARKPKRSMRPYQLAALRGRSPSTIWRGDGDEVHPCQREVGDDARLEHLEQVLAHGRAEKKVVRGKGQQQAQRPGEEQGEEHVSDRTGGGDEEHVSARIAEIARIDGNGLGPAEHERREHGCEREHAHAHGVDVGGGVQRKAAQHPRCGIAALERDPAVGYLVQDDAEKHRNKGYGDVRYALRNALVKHVPSLTIFEKGTQGYRNELPRRLRLRDILNVHSTKSRCLGMITK